MRRPWSSSRATAAAVTVWLGLCAGAAAAQRVRCRTTQGDLLIALHRDWAPRGHERFLELLDSQTFFSGQTFFEVRRKSEVHFGIAADAELQRQWHGSTIADDGTVPELEPRRGWLSFYARSPDSRSTRLVISDSRTRTRADLGPFEQPFGQVLNPELLDKLYAGYGDTSGFVPAMMAHGSGSIAALPKLDRIFRCERMHTALETDMQKDVIEAQLGGQLSDVRQETDASRKQAASDSFLSSGGEDSSQLLNLKGKRADPEGSAGFTHDQVFRALSKTAADSLRVISGAPEEVVPCLPTPDGAPSAAGLTTKALEAEMQANVRSQLQAKLAPTRSCEMRLAAADTGCYGNRQFERRVIARGEWTTEKGGQYRLRGLDLRASSAACVADDNCNYLWMASIDEIHSAGVWGSRALPECSRRPVPGHNLYEKVCITQAEKLAARDPGKPFLQVREAIVAQIRTRMGTAPQQPRVVHEVFDELDVDHDDRLTEQELRRLEKVVTRRWSSSPHKITTRRKKATTRDMSLTQEQLTELFDEDKNGELSAAEAHAMAEFMSLRHKEL